MKKQKIDQAKYGHLPAVVGGIVTSVREEGGQVFYRYRVPARVLAKQRKAVKPTQDVDDIGQGEGCEGGKCEIRRGAK
jgi:hypothetical protein